MQHKVAVWTLLVLATLIAFVASLTIWVDRQMLDNGAWNHSSEQLVQDPEIRSALSVYLVNTLYQNVDVAAALQERLPKGLEPLAAPAAAALRQPAANAVDFMLQRPRVQSLFVNASSTAHQKLINVLMDRTGYGISTGRGVVTLDLSALVTELATELGLPQDAIARIPANTGTITVMKSNQLGLVQKLVQGVHVLSGWLLALVIGMYALAVYLARGARRHVLRTVGWIFVGLGILLLVARKLLGNYVTSSLAAPAYHGVVRAVWAIETSILGQLGWALVFYGIVMLIAITLAGPTELARRFRAWIAPVLSEHQGYAFGAVGGLWVLLVLWGGTHALRTWWGILLIGVLLAAGVAALRRQTLVEFGPPAPEPEVETGKKVALQ
jgi:hypothetical protein